MFGWFAINGENSSNKSRYSIVMVSLTPPPNSNWLFPLLNIKMTNKRHSLMNYTLQVA